MYNGNVTKERQIEILTKNILGRIEKKIAEKLAKEQFGS